MQLGPMQGMLRQNQTCDHMASARTPLHRSTLAESADSKYELCHVHLGLFGASPAATSTHGPRQHCFGCKARMFVISHTEKVLMDSH